MKLIHIEIGNHESVYIPASKVDRIYEQAVMREDRPQELDYYKFRIETEKGKFVVKGFQEFIDWFSNPLTKGTYNLKSASL